MDARREEFSEKCSARMVEGNFEKLSGNEFELTVGTSTRTEIDDVELTPEIIEFYAPYIKTKQELSVEKIKPDLKSGHIFPFARLVKYHKLEYAPKSLPKGKK
jgi:hypothetical protein